jgi:uncharacterized protein YjbI with pentapeptide repeats
MSPTSARSRIETHADIERMLPERLFAGVEIRRVDLSSLGFHGVRFVDADLVEVGLAGAAMTGVVLQRCTLTGNGFRGAVLAHGRIEDCIVRACEGQEAAFRKADLFGVHFDETSLMNVDFEAAELAEVVFSASDLYGARFRDAILSRVRFENRHLGNAVLSRADFTGSILLDCDLTAADLGNACFRDALVVGGRFDDANLSGADFTGARLVGVTLDRTTQDETAALSIRNARIAPDRWREEVLTFLTSAGERLVPLAHALMLGALPRPGGGANQGTEARPEPVARLEPARTGGAMPVKAEPEPETPRPASSGESGGAERSAPVSRDVYERFRKLELD